MGSAVVVELDSVTDHAHGVLLGFEAVAMCALFLQGTDDPLHHAVLLRAVQGDELLLQAIAADQSGVGAAGEDQTVVPVEACLVGQPPSRGSS